MVAVLNKCWHLKMVCQQWDKVQHFNMRLCLDHNNNRCGLSTAARELVCLSSCVSMCVCVCACHVSRCDHGGIVQMETVTVWNDAKG